MNYVGRWEFHSVGSYNENGDLVYLNADEYIDSPMVYIDENDEEALAEELAERKKTTGMQIEVCADGTLYMLMPLPENVTQDEIDAAVTEGAIQLYDGMITDRPMSWEIRNGSLWFDSGIEGEVFGEKADSWIQASTEDGFLQFFNLRYKKND